MWFFKKKSEKVMAIPSAAELREILARRDLKATKDRLESERRVRFDLRDEIARHFLEGNHPWCNTRDQWPNMSHRFDEKYVLELKSELESLGYVIEQETEEYEGIQNVRAALRGEAPIYEKASITYSVIRMKR